MIQMQDFGSWKQFLQNHSTPACFPLRLAYQTLFLLRFSPSRWILLNSFNFLYCPIGSFAQTSWATERKLLWSFYLFEASSGCLKTISFTLFLAPAPHYLWRCTLSIALWANLTFKGLIHHHFYDFYLQTHL